MRLILNPNKLDDYETFLRVKALPTYRIRGHIAEFPDEYAERVNGRVVRNTVVEYTPRPFLFDYQSAIARLALRKRKFCLFLECGLGKTLIFLEYARIVQHLLGTGLGTLIISPAMVVPQTLAECERWYGQDLIVEHVAAANLQTWLDTCGGRIGITNYEALKASTTRGKLGCLILDESSMLKSHYGKWGGKCVELGRGLEWKLAGTGTPAPNDRIEYANHAVFMDTCPTVNSFLATYFVNKGQTSERWIMKHHAIRPFYRALSHWAIFMTHPATYGWKDHADDLPPIHVHIQDVDLTEEQQRLAYEKQGYLFPVTPGGIASRASHGSIAKGSWKGRRVNTLKPGYIKQLVDSWPDESTIIWCIFNEEQAILEEVFPEAASIKGATPLQDRLRMIDDFRAGRIRVMLTKPKILGFGLNLEIATRQVFSGLADSYESFHQAVKRSNRIGSMKPLNVHIPVTDIERPMVENVLRKAHRVQEDTDEQERLFKEIGYDAKQ